MCRAAVLHFSLDADSWDISLVSSGDGLISVVDDAVRVNTRKGYCVHYFGNANENTKVKLLLNGRELAAACDAGATPCGSATVFPKDISGEGVLRLISDGSAEGYMVVFLLYP